MRETRAATDEQAIAILDRTWGKGVMSWVKSAYWRIGADGKSWLGRGYVQLTHKVNYTKLGDAIGMDLAANQALAMREDVALKVLFVGMGERSRHSKASRNTNLSVNDGLWSRIDSSSILSIKCRDQTASLTAASRKFKKETERPT